MSEQDLAAGITAIQDEEVRAKVAEGDLAAAGDLELTEEEQGLLQAAASGEAEVVGFGINMSLGGLSAADFKFQKLSPDAMLNQPQIAHKGFPTADKYRPG